jgi:hypothetical protein
VSREEVQQLDEKIASTYLRVGSRSTRVAGVVDVAQIRFRPSGSSTNREEIYKIKEMNG